MKRDAARVETAVGAQPRDAPTAGAAPDSAAGESPAGLFDALDARLHSAVQHFRAPVAEPVDTTLRGLYISDAEVDGLLSAGAAPSRSVRVAQVAAQLPRLARTFALEALDVEVLLMCLAPEVDLRYERLYGYLHDDMTRRRPTIDLLLRLLEADSPEIRHALSPGGRLQRRGLIASQKEEPAEEGSFLSTTLRLEPRVSEFLLGVGGLDRRMAQWSALVVPSAQPLDTAYLAESGALAESFSSSGSWEAPGPIVYVYGADLARGTMLARGWAGAVGSRLLVVDVAAWRLAHGGPLSVDQLVAVTREAMLQNATLVLYGVEPVVDRRFDTLQMSMLRSALQEYPRLAFLIGRERWEASTCWTDRLSLSLTPGTISSATRAEFWAAHLDERFPAHAAHELGTRYHFVEEERMRAVAQGALGRAALRGSEKVAFEDVIDAARAVSSPVLGELARRLEPRHTWSDIVLRDDASARLHELCARFRHRAMVYEDWGYGSAGLSRPGTAALFVGLPGTGKTMAAEIVAGDLGYDLYRIDLSAVVSKYVGETEKNLETIFRAAEQGEVVLLFDEADALFGKRSEVRDAHDRYANIEVAYLLQRLETYSGVAILTSNLNGNLDEAFLRRLDVIVEFPFPEEAERREIWRRSLPGAAPRAEDVDVEDLAHAFKLTGGHIRNSALTAAFLAASEGEPISRRHLLHGIRREYEKVGKLITELEPFASR